MSPAIQAARFRDRSARPSPRDEFFETGGGLEIDQFGEHIGEVDQWIDAMQLRLSVRHMSNLLNRGRTIADYGPQLQGAPEGYERGLRCLLSLNEFYYF